MLVSVLTCSEGDGLEDLAKGLVLRYSQADEPPPIILYVDRDCCAQGGITKASHMFSRWSDIVVRLDVWHWMRRLASCCIETHDLYAVFMSKLSSCVFEWDREDLVALWQAKHGSQPTGLLSNAQLLSSLTRKELARHCRRRTRGVQETTELVDQLIRSLDCEDGRDTLGVQLFDHERMQSTWEQQRKHIACLHDPPDVQLYTRTATVNKNGVELPVYRCARGSTSLESFHLYINRFIPGIRTH